MYGGEAFIMSQCIDFKSKVIDKKLRIAESNGWLDRFETEEDGVTTTWYKITQYGQEHTARMIHKLFNRVLERGDLEMPETDDLYMDTLERFARALAKQHPPIVLLIELMEV
jgi:hypothetical protein